MLDSEPAEIDQIMMEKGWNTVRNAVTYESGEVFQHFGRSEQLNLYDAEEGKTVSEQVVGTPGSCRQPKWTP